ncbi:MAG: hypothetical protein DRQ47_10615, partial [Gammaproteobacteria bacterium]
VTVIQLYDNFTDMYTIIGDKEYTGEFEMENIKYFHIPKEENRLEFFLRYMEKLKPSIVAQFNGQSFDLPYMTNRIARVLDGYDGDFYNDYKEDLNHKNSYVDMPNVLRLSPVGVVEGVPSKMSKDGMESVACRWKGIIHFDQREATLKHGFLGLPSYSLNSLAQRFGVTQKVDVGRYRNFDGGYSGDGYIHPDNDEPFENIEAEKIRQLQRKRDDMKAAGDIYSDEYQKVDIETRQTVYNMFISYSIRDVTVMLEVDEKSKYLNVHKAIAYESSVTMDMNWGTLAYWYNMLYREAEKHNLIMPLKQQFDFQEEVFVGGIVRTMPGHYDCITSFDFASLYPSLIRAWNIGADTLVKDYEMPKELKELREKYFSSHFNLQKLNKENQPFDDEFGNPIDVPIGEYVKKYGEKFTNDLIEEGIYHQNIMDNKENILPVLQEYDVTVTPNGYFYKRDKQSIFADRMKTLFEERIKDKKAGQKQSGVVNELKKANASPEEIRVAFEKQEYFENQSQVKKIMLNAAFGASSMEAAQFSNGKVTGASITTAGRLSNRTVALRCNDYIRGLLGEEITLENKAELKHIPQIDTDSFYLDLTSIMKMDKFKDLPEDKKTELALKISSTKIQKIIDDEITNIGETLNLYEPESLVMENEVITGSFISLAPKRYFCDVKVNDGVILQKSKQKIVGVSLVSYSTPPMLKGMLKPVIDIALDGGEKQLREYIKEQRIIFGKSDPKDFVRKAKVNNLDYKKVGLKYKRQKENGKWLTAPMGSVSSLEYNRLLKDLDIVGKYDLIERGDSISYVYTRMPNKYNLLGSVAFMDDRFSKEIGLVDIADYNIHWEKDFINKIDIIIKPLKWDIHKRTPDIVKW